MPAKSESIEDLKKQLADLQDKVARYEAPVSKPSLEVKELYSWEAPERLFIPRNKHFFTRVFLLVLLLILVLLFLQQFIIIAPVLAIAFVSYAFASVPPENLEHKLTTQGINSDNRSYLWQELGDFWFSKRNGQTLINIDTYLNYPRRLILLLGKGDQEKIKETMVQYIPFRELPKITLMDKAADWLSAKFHKFAD